MFEQHLFTTKRLKCALVLLTKKKISIIDKRLPRQQLVEVLDALLEDKVTPSNVAQGAYGKEKIIEGFL